MRTAAAILLACTLIIPLAAHADGKVKVQVSVIQASKDGAGVDPRLADLQKQLTAFEFTAYKLLSQQTLSLGLGETRTVDLPGAGTLEVTAKEQDGGKLRTRIVWKQAHGPRRGKAQKAPEVLVDTTYVIEDGGTFMVGGPKHAAGTLVLALTHAAGGS